MMAIGFLVEICVPLKSRIHKCNVSFAKVSQLVSSNFSFMPINQLSKTIAIALVASSAAFAPALHTRTPTKLNFEYGEYDDKMWDQTSKKDVYNKWYVAFMLCCYNYVS